MKLYLWIALLLLATIPARAGLHKMTGRVTDSSGTAIDGASVSLLYPADSTLAFFAISNPSGGFSINDAKEGTYVLQIAMMGYYTEYVRVDLPAANNNNLGAISLKQNIPGTLLSEVIISGEKVPVRVLGDTLEYNAGSYKVKPDAMVEDLLRKLPGVQVDNEGNIKAMGKDVSRVLVDGKEFFGNDPKMATRNLPADAIDKIQAFEKKSDESLFTGVDDGSREQTLNLKLKDGKKTGYFGEAMGALGTPDRYDASLRAFKFRPKSQLAALGMFNNINKFGFSFGDYL
ncbi:MAG: TonB-dependent receptor, partial [Sphingobacteriales bacterium]